MTDEPKVKSLLEHKAKKGKAPIESFCVQQSGTPIMLKVLMSNGEMYSFGYPYLVRVLFYSEDKLSIYFSEGTVHLTGSCLVPLFDALSDHTVSWVKQAKECEMTEQTYDVTLLGKWHCFLLDKWHYI